MFLIDKGSWSTSALRRSVQWLEVGSWKATRTANGRPGQVPGPSAPGRGLRSLRNRTQGPDPPLWSPAGSPAQTSPRAPACKSVLRSRARVCFARRRTRTLFVQVGPGWRRWPTSAAPSRWRSGRRRAGAQRWGLSSDPSRFRSRRRASWSPSLGLWTWRTRCKSRFHPHLTPAPCPRSAALWPLSWNHPGGWRWTSLGSSRLTLLPLSFLLKEKILLLWIEIWPTIQALFSKCNTTLKSQNAPRQQYLKLICALYKCSECFAFFFLCVYFSCLHTPRWAICILHNDACWLLRAKCVLAWPTLSETRNPKALAHLFLIKKPNKEQPLLF